MPDGVTYYMLTDRGDFSRILSGRPAGSPPGPVARVWTAVEWAAHVARRDVRVCALESGRMVPVGLEELEERVRCQSR